MKKVSFIKQWRGYQVGASGELTDERAAELIKQGYCQTEGVKHAASTDDQQKQPAASKSSRSKGPPKNSK